MRNLLLILLFSLFFAFTVQGSKSFYLSFSTEITFNDYKEPNPIKRRWLKKIIQKRYSLNPRGTAILLTVAAGPLGAHRVYLGTHYSVPLFYTITLGGGLGILPATDLIILLFSKDISKFYNNDKIFMWDVD